MEDLDERIVTLMGELNQHRGDMTHSIVLQLSRLLYERAKEGCLSCEEAQLYRQQGSALAMRDLIEMLEGSHD